MLYLHQKKSKGMKIKELTIDEMLKLKAVVLYVINKCDEIDYFHSVSYTQLTLPTT